jgi:hypothetical protein
MAKISDRDLPGWINSPESRDFSMGMAAPLLEPIEDSDSKVLLPSNQSSCAFPFWGNKKLLETMTASFLGVTAILFFLHHQHQTIPPVEAVNSMPTVALMSDLLHSSQVPMQQVHVLDRTFVKVLRIPEATEVANLNVQTGSTRLPQNPVLK